MEQLVRVKETYDDGTALVIHVRESACSGDCHKCSGCGAAKEAVLFTAENRIGARSGDLVKIESETGPVLKAATVLYMMPLVLFFGGYLIGALLNVSGALCGCLAFVLSIVLIVVYDRKVVKKANLGYTITAFAGDALLQSGRREEHNHG
nr:SoxR reducing system RseC family protein [Oscillospiraceae bacterium]